MFTKESLAIVAWETYSKAVGGKAFNGDPLPTWAEMVDDPSKAHLVEAWRKTAGKVAATTINGMNDLFLSLTEFKEEVTDLLQDAIKARIMRETSVMPVEAAYVRVRALLDDLAASGIAVSIYPSKGRKDRRLLDKYGTPDRLRPELWVNVEIEPTTADESARVASLRDSLTEQGICFDTGGGMGSLDWQLDWSFHLGGNVKNSD